MSAADPTILERVRVLVAPCGCYAAADVTDSVPGFCRAVDEAREDVRDGFTETTMSADAWRGARLGCEHSPEWGRK